jgi:hypothetical protein
MREAVRRAAVTVLVKKRKDKKLWMRFFSAKGISIIILAMALLKALIELASAILSFIT